MAAIPEPWIVETPAKTMRLNICHDGDAEIIQQTDDLIHIRLRPGTVLEFYSHDGRDGGVNHLQVSTDASEMWE